MDRSVPSLRARQLPSDEPLGRRHDRRPLAWALVLLAPLVFGVALRGLIAGEEPFASWFYVFGWWSYIALVDGVTHLRSGRSRLLSRPLAFATLLSWSCLFWLAFEVLNWRLANWHYVGLPGDALARRLGIFVSFATVLPGVLGTADLLRSLGAFEGLRVDPARWRVSESRLRWVSALGWASLLLPLAFPRYFFPLVWGSTTLLLEPFLARRGHPGLWTLFAAGRAARLAQLLAAGAITGLLWESWNFWATAKWIYTVPWFEDSKLFEMPLAGFLGFPPFALECYTFTRFLVCAHLVPEVDPALPRVADSGAVTRRQALGAAAAALVCLPLILGVDRLTVRSTAPLPAELEALRAPQRELVGLARMGMRGAAWLDSVGVEDRAALAARDFETLWRDLEERGQGPAPAVTRAEARVWWRRARTGRVPIR